jgi:hypothetical protein
MEIPDLTTFTPVKTIDRRFSSTTFFDGASATFYEKQIDGVTMSAGLHSINGKNIYIAWGDKALPDCSYHAFLFLDPPVIGEGCIDFTLKDNQIIFKEGEKTYTYSIV